MINLLTSKKKTLTQIIYKMHILRLVRQRLCRLRYQISNNLISSSNKFLFALGCGLHPRIADWFHAWAIALSSRFLARSLPVVVVWDYLTCNCKFGDFIYALTVARLLSSAGFTVVFVEIFSDYDMYYNDRGTSDCLFREFVSQREKLLKFAFSPHQSISLWQGSFSDFMLRFNNNAFTIIARHQVIARQYLIALYHNLLSPLYCVMPVRRKELFLASMYEHSASERVISTNFRWNPARPMKNNSIQQLNKIIEAATGAGYNVKIATDDIGYLNLISTAQYISNADNVMPLQSSDYLSDFIQLTQSSNYCQFSGGGMSSIVMVFSPMPYIVYQPCGHLVPWSPNRIFSFSTQQQIYRSSLDFDSFIAEVEQLFPKALGHH